MASPAAFAPFAGASVERIVLAVSGGSDSTALLYAAARMRAELPPLLAVTIDHGLRSEAAAEASRVGEDCARVGVRHVVERLPPAPAAGVAAWARSSRHDVLRRHAGPNGVVLLGHTLDDVAETVVMRARRGPGAGLAGIAPATLVGATWFYRPFIAAPRTALRRMLERTGWGWIDDPTNADARHERARTRLGMNAAARGEAIETAERWSRRRRAMAATAANHLGARLVRTADDAMVHDWDDVIPCQAIVLRALLPVLSGRPYPPPPASTSRAIAALRRGERFTIGGCVLSVGGGALRVGRDPRALRRPRCAQTVRVVPSFDWSLHSVIEPWAAPPPVQFPVRGRGVEGS